MWSLSDEELKLVFFMSFSLCCGKERGKTTREHVLKEDVRTCFEVGSLSGGEFQLMGSCCFSYVVGMKEKATTEHVVKDMLGLVLKC